MVALVEDVLGSEVAEQDPGGGRERLADGRRSGRGVGEQDGAAGATQSQGGGGAGRAAAGDHHVVHGHGGRRAAGVGHRHEEPSWRPAPLTESSPKGSSLSM